MSLGQVLLRNDGSDKCTTFQECTQQLYESTVRLALHVKLLWVVSGSAS